MSTWKDLGTLLQEYGLITRSDLEEGLKHQKETAGLRLGEALVQLGKISTDDIEWVLSKQLDVPFVIVDDVTVNPDLLYKFPRSFLIDNRVLPLFETEDRVSVVMEDPFNKEAIKVIRDSFGKEVEISTGSGRKIEEILRKCFNKVGLPELIDVISAAIERIKGTSFYRMDFLLEEHSCRINVFGAGLLREIATVKGQYRDDDIFRAFDGLDIPLLFEQAAGNQKGFLAVYPLQGDVKDLRMPAIIGEYGLVLPGGTSFSDAHVSGASTLYSLPSPLDGYPYIATQKRIYPGENVIYTVDAAPKEFEHHYVRTVIPAKCPSCRGGGCPSCRDLGYRFSKLEGVYSADELRERLKEVHHGKD